MYIKKSTMPLIMINLLVIILATYNQDKMLVLMSSIVWIDMVWYSSKKLESRAALFAFLLSFFVFLLGKNILEQLGLHTIEMDFSSDINRHADISLLLSLSFLFLGYIFSSRVGRIFKNKKEVLYNQGDSILVRDISKKIFYGTFLVNLLKVVDIVLFVMRNGYIAYYLRYTSSLPYLVGKIGDMAVIAFWGYLATMPSKNEAKRPILLYFIYLMITLGTGKRFPLVAGLLTIFVYYVARNRINSEEEWFGKKQLRLCLIVAPVLVVILFFSSFIREGNSVSSDMIKNALTDFIYNQGASLNLLKRAKMYADKLPQGKIYSIGSTLDLLQANFFSRMLGIKSYTLGNTVERATQGNSFAHAMSYIVMGNAYLNGRGTGSCYIAEAYHDFGYIGVIVINIIYGVILQRMFDLKNKGPLRCAIVLIMFNALLLAPRGSADAFFAELFDPTTWITLIGIFGLARLYKHS